MKAILIGLGLTILLIFGGVLLVTKTNNTAVLSQSGNAQAGLDRTDHEWGKIGINNGKVRAEFTINNSGTGVLQLANVATSCACTTAQVIIDDKASPYFGMHTKSSWTGKVEPGKSAQLLVEFDPAFHGPQGVGQITRQTTVETNDPNQRQLTFITTAEVIK